MSNLLLNQPGLLVSVDVEDWPQSTWDRNLEITERAAANTARLLDLLAQQRQTITLFVLGKFAEKFPQLVRHMAQEGHEIASHGYGHEEIFRQTPAQFRADILRSKNHLEDLIGQPVLGYRAPDFSIITDTLWALDILAEAGFVYDSSIFPIQHSRYGIAWWPRQPTQVKLAEGRTIFELPIATLELGGRRWPVAGGGYHRLLPWPLIRWSIAHNLAQQEWFVAYCHPYEFDAEEFKAIQLDIPLKTRLHQGLGRRQFSSKFVRMLKKFKTRPINQIVCHQKWPVYDPFVARNHREN